MELQNKILKYGKVDWQMIQDLQPDDAKPIYNYEHLKNSLITNGFSNPLFVWEDEDGTLWSVDGKTRREVLRDLQNDIEVPNELPAIFLDAKDRKQAIKMLLEVFNMRENPFDYNILQEWIQLEEVNIEIESVNIQKFELEEEDIEHKENVKELANMIAVSLTDEETEIWQNVKEKIGKLKDKNAIFELIKYYSNENNIN